MSAEKAIADLGPDFELFWTFWNDLPKTNSVPHISDYFDKVVPSLQPNVVIMDLLGPSQMEVRLTGTAIAEFAGEITGSQAESLYQGETRQKALAVAWTAVNFPCGYVVQRLLRSSTGLLTKSSSLVLPVETDSPERKTLIGFNELPQRKSGMAGDHQIETVQDFGAHTWLDIGEGVPT